MKVTNWTRKLLASIVAGGALAPGMSYALDIPVGDASFENYVVPANPGYAYAVPPSGSYRPTSPWVDDLDSPPGFSQDAGSSNWIYDANYAQTASATNKRAAPRTGNQAMHGLDGNYNAQELTTLFEADKTYTFSLWAQDDVNHDQNHGVGLYIFDGNVPFSATNALNGAFTANPSQRIAGMTAVQSQANWGQLKIQATVFAGDAAVGHPIGVGFRAFRDSAVDDATLSVDPAINSLMSLEVNTTNGQVRIRNQTGATVNIDYYEIRSGTIAAPGTSLDATAWNSLQEQNLAGFPAGNGSGNGWEQFGGSTSSIVGESYLTGNSGISTTPIGLGAAYTVGGTHDIVFKYGAFLSTAPAAQGDYNNDGVVNAADYVLWRKGGPLQNDPTPGVQAADYDFWRSHFGNTGGGPIGSSTLLRGPVFYVTSFSGGGSGSSVPEPASVILVGIGIATSVVGSRRRTAST